MIFEKIMQQTKEYKYCYIYKLILKDQSTYIGLRHCNCLPENDKYQGSGRGYKKEDILKKEILITGQFDDKTLALLETVAIMDDKCQNERNVNRNLGAYQYNQFCLSRLDVKTHQLMSEKAKKRWKDPKQYDYLKKCRERQMTVTRKQQISKTVRNTCSDPDWKRKHSEAIKKALADKDLRGHTSKGKVQCVESKKIFLSRAEAARYYGFDTCVIRRCLLTGKPPRGFPNLHFQAVT